MKTKKLLFVLSFILAITIVGYCFAEDDDYYQPPEPETPESICPKTKISGQMMCLNCHTSPSFKLKESSPQEGRNYPSAKMWVDKNIAYLNIDGIISEVSADSLTEFLYYLDWHPETKHMVLNIYSYGGDLFQGWRMIGYLDQYKAMGYTVETRNYGISASAAFLVFVAGSKGHRLVSVTSQGMAHELRQYGSLLDLFKGLTPSDSEEKTRIMKYLQESINIWLAKRGKLSVDEIKEFTTNKEFWMRGEDAIKYGFADGYIK